MPSDDEAGGLNLVRCPRCRRLGALRKGARGLLYVEHAHDLGDGKIALSRCYLGRARGRARVCRGGGRPCPPSPTSD